jgi:hypothetical protein
VRGDILEWLKTYLTDRKQKVVLNNTESEVGCLYAGVPQGSVLCPILFLIYINDIAGHTEGICRPFCRRYISSNILVTIYKTCRTWLILTSQTLKSGVKTG